MNLLDLMIKIGVDDQASNGIAGIADKAKNTMSALGSGLATAAKVGTAAVGAATTAMTALSTAALNATGDLEQNTGGLQKVFADVAGDMLKISETSYEKMGLSSSNFMATANKIGALLQGSGFSIDDSARLAANSMQRAADVASIMGIDVTAAMEAVTGAAKGNFTMMDNLGVAISEANMELYLMEKGVTTAWREMSTMEKSTYALQKFMEDTAYAAGNYAKENDTLAGSLTTAKAALKDFLSGAGDARKVADAFSNAARVVTRNVKDIIPRLSKGLAEISEELAPQIPVIFEEALPAIVEGATTLLKGVVKIGPQLAEIILDEIPVFVNSVGQVGRELVFAISSIGKSVTLAFADVVKQVTGVDINPLLDSFGGVVDLISEGFKEIAQRIDTEKIAEKVNGFISGIASSINGLVEIVKGQGFRTMISNISGFLEAFTAEAANNLKPVGGAIRDLFKEFSPKLPGIVESLSGALGKFLGFANSSIIEPVSKLAAGVIRLFSPFVSGTASLIQNVADSLGVLFEYASEKLSSPLRSLADTVVKLFDSFTPQLKETIDNVVASVGAFILQIGQKAIDDISAFLSSLDSIILIMGPVIENFMDGVTAVTDFVSALIAADGDIEATMFAIGEYFGTAAANIMEFWNDVLTFFDELPEKILGFFDGIDVSFSDIGEKIGSGLKKGLENAVSGIKSWWDGVKSGFNSELSASQTQPTPTSTVRFTDSSIGKSSAAVASTILTGISSSGSSQPVNVNLNLDGHTVAQVVYDPLKQTAKQKGSKLAPLM